MNTHPDMLNNALKMLQACGMTPTSLIIGLLESETHSQYIHELFVEHSGLVLSSLSIYAGRATLEWAQDFMKQVYSREMLALSDKNTGLQFRASKASAAQVAAFNLEDIGTTMRRLAPTLWDLLEAMLSADGKAAERRLEGGKAAAKRVHNFLRGRKAVDLEGDDLMAAAAAAEVEEEEGSDDEYWRDTVLLMEAPSSAELIAERSKTLMTIKKVLCMSVLVQNTNHRCNALQSIIGLFLQSAGTPETVVELLSRLGVSLTTSSINNMVKNLSKESVVEMKKLGRTLLASYAYDNVDIDLKHATPTGDALQDTLIHLTSGTMIQLEHGITPEMLACSEQLWKRCKHNPKALPRDIPMMTGYNHLLDIHPEAEHPSGLTRRDRFGVWVFLRDLIKHGPLYFRKFQRNLVRPEPIDPIPITKSRQVPCRMMNINPSTNVNNISVLEDLFRQAGVGDRSESNQMGVGDIGDQVILVHGDLLTGEQIQSLQETRSKEATPWRRFQFVVYVLGLFHLKMACADAVWRMFIQPLKARGREGIKRESVDSLMSHVSIMRPRETIKIETNPGFRRIHETIEHVGIVSRLDCWRLQLAREGAHLVTLDDFAESEPQWEDLQRIAVRLVQEQVASGATFSDLRAQPAAFRDQEHENMLLRQQHFLLYEEMTYALNEGDIGRVEDAFMPWVFVFKGCGKHKYAAQMMKYLHNVHFVYPEGLKRAVRMNILCNPTGTRGRFRAIDWWVEHNNLYLKRIYGGQYSNHTKDRILEESPLIELYKNTRIQIENVFHLDHRTTRHSAPDMTTTFKMLTSYMEKHKTNELVPGRRSPYSVPDAAAQGMHSMLTSWQPARASSDADDEDEDLDEEEEDIEQEVEEEEDDIEQEVGDDGGLDM